MKRRTVLAGLTTLPVFLQRVLADEPLPPSRLFLKPATPITSADQVLNVMDFEPLARAALPPAHFGYMATGADDDAPWSAITRHSRTTKSARIASMM
jgi:hypothetical protein